MSIELADITTCIHCGQKFSHPRLTIIGNDHARLNSYMKGLNDHLAKKHPEIGLLMAQTGAAFMELIFLRNFQSTDPELSEQQDRVRWQVHQQTLKARYPDENLEVQARQLAGTLLAALRWTDEDHIDIAETSHLFEGLVSDTFRSIRDALEEPGKYPGVVQESGKVLV
jgi:hypothetical protein